VTLFDGIALLVLVISGLVGFSRGAVREMVTVLAFGLAALASVMTMPLAGSIARKTVHPDWAANALAVVVVFVVVYILLRLAGSWVTAKLHSQAALGTLDRLIGLGFGVIRALIFLGVFYLVFNAATPPELTPRWIADARLLPVAQGSADMIQAMAPRGMKAAGRLGPALERAVEPTGNETLDVTEDTKPAPEPVAPAPRPATKAQGGYGKTARDDIDALVERSR
jgi:membrane protein required for colicin V production